MIVQKYMMDTQRNVNLQSHMQKSLRHPSMCLIFLTLMMFRNFLRRL
uniref:DNA-directed RNA polymerase III subunit rpc1 n=1 Tax=Rhizophora mucronata TaxID=61149 RepID=A0A2P2LRN6_RHIMU